MSRVARVAEEETQEIEVSLGSVPREPIVDDGSDTFRVSADELRKYNGLSANFKRQMTRQVQKAHRGANGVESRKNEFDEITGYTLFEVVLPPYNLDYLAKLNEISSPNYAAIKAKVANIVGLGFDFVESPKTKRVMEGITEEKKLQRNRRKLAEAKEAILEWIDSCNEHDEFMETLIKVWTDYEATGNGYFEIGRTLTGEIGYIGHIPSTTMRIRKFRDGFVQVVANQAVFFRNFGDLKKTNPINDDRKCNEVIHLKKYSPTNGFYGVPDVIAAKTAVAGNEFASRFNLDYFENKAVPRYVIVIKGGRLSNKAEKELLEFFQTNLRGKNHRTLYVPLPAEEDGKKVDFKMEAVEAGVQDASFDKYRKGNLNEILMAHRVPINKVSIAEGVSLASARDADKTFKEQVCRPEQKILEKKLNKIIAERTDAFVFKLNELTLTDEDTQSKIDERYLRMQVIVPNEVRARAGLPGLPGGDKPVELKPQQVNEQKTQASGNRQRDQQRTGNSTDSASSTNTRAPKGEGRQQS